MSERDWKLYVEDILEAINFIEDYIENYTFERFISDRKTIDAVVRNLEVIGEASKHIPEEIKDKYRSIDWFGIRGLRNRITHEYFGLSYKIIWKIITEELPILEKEFIKIKNERDFDF